MKLTIEQLADKVNELIADKIKDSSETIKDGRQSSVLSTRRIRDYITKGLIEKPVGLGREKWFDESHVNALVSIRLLQHNGLSEQYISSTKSELLNDSLTYTNDEGLGLANFANLNSSLNNSENNSDDIMQKNAMNFLKSLQKNDNQGVNQNLNSSLGLSGSALNLTEGSPLIGAASTFSNSLEKKFYAKQADTDLLRSLTQTQYRQFNEYLVDDKLGVFLKVDSKTDMTLQKKLLETIKNEIINHNKENKND